MVIFTKTDQVRTKKIEIEVNQEKIDYVNYGYSEEIRYWKKQLREGFKREWRKRIVGFSTFKSLLISKSKECKDSGHWWNNLLLEIQVLSTLWRAKGFYSWCSNRGTFLWSNNWLLENFFKIYKRRWKYEPEKQVFLWRWILMASKVYRGENLSCRFEDWLYCLRKIKRKASDNYRNLFKLMSAAPKLMICR